MATVDNFIPNRSGSLSDSPPPLLITQYGEEEGKDPFDSTTASNVASIPAALGIHAFLRTQMTN